MCLDVAELLDVLCRLLAVKSTEPVELADVRQSVPQRGKHKDAILSIARLLID